MSSRAGFVYASQTGNAEAICVDIFESAVKKKLVDPEHSRCLSLNQLDTLGLATFPILVVVASTTGDADPPDNAKKAWRKMKKEQATDKLKGVHFGVLCLGDQNYENFCGFGRDLDAKLECLGGSRFIRRGEADDGVGLEQVVEPWKEEVLGRLPDALTSRPVHYSSEGQKTAPPDEGSEYLVESPLRNDNAGGPVPSAHPQPMTRYCYITTVKDGKTSKYRDLYNNIFPEAVATLRTVGITLYTICEVPGMSQLILNIHTSGTVDLDEALRSENVPERFKEWEKLLNDCIDGWKLCEEIHSSDVEWNTAHAAQCLRLK